MAESFLSFELNDVRGRGKWRESLHGSAVTEV